jgi:hypothetical protein
MMKEDVPQYFRGKILMGCNRDSISLQPCGRLIPFIFKDVENVRDLRIEVIDI